MVRRSFTHFFALALLAVALAQGAPVRADEEAPSLPPYFTATSPDEAKPLWPDAGGGASGVWAAPATGADDPSKLAIPDLYDRIAHNLFSINMVWTLVAGFLVMFMQAGFMFVETGLCRAKNAAHTVGMNLMIYPLGCIAFWAYGFAIGWGNWWNGPVAAGLVLVARPGPVGAQRAASASAAWTACIGHQGLLPRYGVDDVSVMALFFFMMVFMDTTATIPTGAMAERWAGRTSASTACGWRCPTASMPTGCGAAAGWLRRGINWGLGHGAVDFAGSGVVHAMGGIIALAGAIVIGPRIGKYVNGKPQAIPGHNIPMVVLGTFILAFGWFGFNRLDARRHRPAHQLRRREHDARQRHRRARRAC